MLSVATHVKGLTLKGEIDVASVSKSSTVLKRVVVEHFISEMTHKPNILKFWVKSVVSNSLVKLFLNQTWMIPLTVPS
jgi:hypothetical protein